MLNCLLLPPYLAVRKKWCFFLIFELYLRFLLACFLPVVMKEHPVPYPQLYISSILFSNIRVNQLFMRFLEGRSFYSIGPRGAQEVSRRLVLNVWFGPSPIISLIGRDSLLRVYWSMHWNNHSMHVCSSFKTFMDHSDIRKIIASTFRNLICNIPKTLP